jgi:hypothetical protein
MPADPKARFLQYVGAETDGGKRPKGKGFITEKQRQNLNPAYLDYLVQRNKKKNHYPKRVSDEKWSEVKKELQAKHKVKQVAGKNPKPKPTKPKPKNDNSAVPSVAPSSASPLRRSGRLKKKKKK